MSDTSGAPDEEVTGQPSSTDTVANKRRESKKVRKEREDREFFKLIMASEVGRRFLWAIINECKPFDNEFAFGPVGFPDVHETFFRLGKREIGQKLYQTWHLRDPENVMKMLVENDKRYVFAET